MRYLTVVSVLPTVNSQHVPSLQTGGPALELSTAVDVDINKRLHLAQQALIDYG